MAPDRSLLFRILPQLMKTFSLIVSFSFRSFFLSFPSFILLSFFLFYFFDFVYILTKIIIFFFEKLIFAIVFVVVVVAVLIVVVVVVFVTFFLLLLLLWLIFSLSMFCYYFARKFFHILVLQDSRLDFSDRGRLWCDFKYSPFALEKRRRRGQVKAY
jgi:hypothetical protein